MTLIFRKNFIDCCESIFRELGFPPPAMIHDEKLPLVMELEYGGFNFEICHSTTDLSQKALVLCDLGPLPEANILAVVKNILFKNLLLVRAHQAYFGLREETKSLSCIYFEELDQWNVSDWLQKMKNISVEASDLKNYCINFSQTRTVTSDKDNGYFLA